MNKKIFILFILSLITSALFSQNNDSNAQVIAEGKKPVEDEWGCTMLVDAQTSFLPKKGSLELIIQHRFSNLSMGIKDLVGLYGASNIRLALNYSIIDQLMIGFGTEKDNKYQEFFAKAKLLEQNKKGSIPLSLTFFGNIVISGKEKASWGNDFKFIDRLSYFAQLIAARKFCKAFSLEAAISYSHTNKVEGIKIIKDNVKTYKSLYMNDILGVTAGSRINFYNNMSFLLEYDYGYFLKMGENQMLFPKPNLAIGYEIATSTHCFQVFASNYRGIVPQQNFTKNQFDFKNSKGWMLGFNITVRLK